MQRVNARGFRRSNAHDARPRRVEELDRRMRLEEPDDGVAARTLHLVAAHEPTAETRCVHALEPGLLEVPLDSGQRNHGALAARLDEAHAAAGVARVEMRCPQPARIELALDEPGENAHAHRREQLVRLPHHVRGVERAPAHHGMRLVHHHTLARQRQARNLAHHINHNGPHSQNGRLGRHHISLASTLIIVRPL